jgi:hypothetical protein
LTFAPVAVQDVLAASISARARATARSLTA